MIGESTGVRRMTMYNCMQLSIKDLSCIARNPTLFNFQIVTTFLNSNRVMQLETKTQRDGFTRSPIRFIYPRATYVISATNDTFQRNDDDKNFNEVLTKCGKRKRYSSRGERSRNIVRG